jgi:hypothetical protein
MISNHGLSLEKISSETVQVMLAIRLGLLCGFFIAAPILALPSGETEDRWAADAHSRLGVDGWRDVAGCGEIVDGREVCFEMRFHTACWLLIAMPMI